MVTSSVSAEDLEIGELIQERARRVHSAEPRPFLKWAGSKRSVLANFLDILPEQFGTYWEPFVGSGSLFFLLQPESAVISDTCVPLIETYRAISDRVDLVMRYLAPLDVNKDTYYQVRGNPGVSRFKRAAQFIYLNKTCWNGLYRVNSSGQFNVPYGAPKSNYVADEANLRSCSDALGRPGVNIIAGDFEDTVEPAVRGDFVFLDPPYVTGHNNNGFIDYNEVLFSWNDQIRLASLANRLAEKGVHVVVTNAYHPQVIELYEGFEVRRVLRSSTLASSALKRGRVEEAVLWVKTDTRGA